MKGHENYHTCELGDVAGWVWARLHPCRECQDIERRKARLSEVRRMLSGSVEPAVTERTTAESGTVH